MVNPPPPRFPPPPLPCGRAGSMVSARSCSLVRIRAAPAPSGPTDVRGADVHALQGRRMHALAVGPMDARAAGRRDRQRRLLCHLACHAPLFRFAVSFALRRRASIYAPSPAPPAPPRWGPAWTRRCAPTRRLT